jgi:hypothetical protein
MILLFTFRKYHRFWGNTINEWYDKFGMVAIMLDVIIVLIGFWITQWLYKHFFTTFELWKFIGLFLIVQIIHDLLFYFLIIRSSKGSNVILDLMLNYGNKHGALTVVGDSLMVVLAIIMTYWYLSANVDFGTYILILLLSLYLIGFLLYQKW